MNKIKCQSCGVVNWNDASHCLRCKAALIFETETLTGKSYNSGFLVPLLGGGVFLILLVAGYIYLIKGPSVKTAAVAEASTSTNAAAPVTVAVPPPDLNVVAPKIETFASLFREQLIQQNGVWSAGTGNQTGYTRPNDPTGYVTQEGISRSYCAPKVEGEILLAEPGRYHKFGNDIFFGVKIQSKGLEGVLENGICKTKTSMVPLTAMAYLKWSNLAGASGWQASAKGPFDMASLDYNRKTRETKQEEVEKLKYEKWQQQGQENANQQMKEKVFRALN